MLELDAKYKKELETLSKEIQDSDELAKYLEDEEEEDFAQLKEMFEPRIALMHEQVAAKEPLQLVSFEKVLLDPAYEGLYLPKILGYSVLRGEVNKELKYARPQSHFKDVLLAICNSANFDILRKRIGQSIQMGFALSSDIWITNLINTITNKRIRYFLQGQKLERYRRPDFRAIGYNRYMRQFKNDNFYSADFPKNTSELKILSSPLKLFLIKRVEQKADNTSIIPPLKAFVENPEFQGSQEHMEVMGLYAFFFDLSEQDQAHLSEHFEKTRAKNADFADKFLSFILGLHKGDQIDLTKDADLRLSDILDKTKKDLLSTYYKLMDIIHDQGYINDEAQEAVKVFYNKHEGLSDVNECVRQTIFSYFSRLISNLDVKDYSDFFESSKNFPVYMGIFANQQFNQDLKELSMAYIRKLLKKYTDKRGKDYQDIKKFVSTTFLDLGFLKEKEIVELFKTRRKRKKVE